MNSFRNSDNFQKIRRTLKEQKDVDGIRRELEKQRKNKIREERKFKYEPVKTKEHLYGLTTN